MVIAMPLSAEHESSVDIAALIGASAALHLSSVPFEGRLAPPMSVSCDGELTPQPRRVEQLEASNLDLLVVATANGIVMAGASAATVPDRHVIEAITMRDGYGALPDHSSPMIEETAARRPASQGRLPDLAAREEIGRRGAPSVDYDRNLQGRGGARQDTPQPADRGDHRRACHPRSPDSTSGYPLM